MSKFGSSMTKNVTAPIVAAAAVVGALTVKAAGMADEMLTLSAQTGLTTESIQGLKYASELVDVEFEVMTKGMSKVVKQMGAAVDKGEDYIEVAEGMNVSIRDSSGSLKSTEQVFYDTVDAIGKLGSETEKEIATQKIFGKSYQDLMPLIKAGSGAIKGYIEEAKKMGIIVSQKDLESLGKLDDSIVRLKAVAGAAGAKLAVALVPVIERLAPVIEQSIVPAIMSFIDKIAGLLRAFSELNPGVQTTILSVVGIAAAMGPVIGVIGTFLRNLTMITSVLGGVSKAAKGAKLAAMFAAVPLPVLAIAVAIGVVIGAIVYMIKHWDKVKAKFEEVKAAAIRIFNSLKQWFWSWGYAVLGPFGMIAKIIHDNWDEIKQTGQNAFSAVAGAVQWVIDKVQLLIQGIKDGITWLKELGKTNIGATIGAAVVDSGYAVPMMPEVETPAADTFVPTVADMSWIEEKIYGRKADGGWINRAGAYLVGEEGPEVVNLNAGDYVTSNDEWAGLRPIHRREKFIGEGEAEGVYKRGEGIFKGFEAWLREGLMNNEMMGFADGGIVPGPLGSPQLAVVHGGEEVLTPAQRQAGGGVMNHTGTITVKGVNNANELIGIAEILADNISRNDRRLPSRVSLVPI